jgi:hypothetical protein
MMMSVVNFIMNLLISDRSLSITSSKKLLLSSGQLKAITRLCKMHHGSVLSHSTVFEAYIGGKLQSLTARSELSDGKWLHTKGIIKLVLACNTVFLPDNI